MYEKLKWNTVSESLAEVLRELMKIEELDFFRLVGGTALSLRLGHRESFDIDLFTDAEYGSVNFREIKESISRVFPYIDKDSGRDLTIGFTRRIGLEPYNMVKLDLYYTDSFIGEYFTIEGIRMAGIEDIAAMKLEVVSQGGRRRDFWDIHELLELYSFNELLQSYEKRYPWVSVNAVIEGMTDFSLADEDYELNCFKGKFWELIKIDLEEVVETFNKGKN